MPTRFLHLSCGVAWLVLASAVPQASADSPAPDDSSVAVDGSSDVSSYPLLTSGRLVVVNARRFAVTEEPPPVATLVDPPPPPEAEARGNRPRAPGNTAIWVAGHWAYSSNGLVWVAGRYIDGRRGHVFVPPRWAEHEDRYLFFNGFFVPYNVYVRSHFNRYYYSGLPNAGSGARYGPYWPVGAPGQTNQPLTSANARDPYWPVGAPR